MKRKRLIAAVATVCAIAAGTAAIAQGSGSSRKSATASASSAQVSPAGFPGGGGPGAQAVHSASIVLDKAGTAFIAQTTDQGKIESVDSAANTITIVEGSKSVTYKTVTLSVPSQATVTLDGKTSALGDLAAGDRVSVSVSSDGTTVSAIDSSFHPQGGPGMRGPATAGQSPSTAG